MTRRGMGPHAVIRRKSEVSAEVRKRERGWKYSLGGGDEQGRRREVTEGESKEHRADDLGVDPQVRGRRPDAQPLPLPSAQ